MPKLANSDTKLHEQVHDRPFVEFFLTCVNLHHSSGVAGSSDRKEPEEGFGPSSCGAEQLRVGISELFNIVACLSGSDHVPVTLSLFCDL